MPLQNRPAIKSVGASKEAATALRTQASMGRGPVSEALDGPVALVSNPGSH